LKEKKQKIFERLPKEKIKPVAKTGGPYFGKKNH